MLESCFTAESEHKFIRFEPCERDLWGNNHCNNENCINILELSYRQEDEDGWGAGGGEYITAQDIAAISEGIQKIIGKKITNFSYSCLDDIIQISVAANEKSLITLTISMLETLGRKYYISITQKDLSLAEFEENTKMFIEWERMFPTLDPSLLSLYHETYNKVFEYDCDNQSRCEASFNTGVDEMLRANPYKFGDFLKRVSDFLCKNPDVDPVTLTRFIKESVCEKTAD